MASKSPGAPVPLRVFIFNDSPTMRVALKAALTQFPDIVVVAEADSAEHASELIERAKPDVVLMDVIMPGKDGYEATREIMDRVPTPIVMVSAIVDPSDSRVVFEALTAGALCIAEAPPPPTDPRYKSRSGALAQLLRVMAAANVKKGQAALASEAPPRVNDVGRQSIDAIGVVASTGGPSALVRLLSQLPERCPSVLVVQHLAHGFAESFAAWLEERTGHPVKVARDGEYLRSGMVYLAPDDCHLELSGGRTLRVHREPAFGLFRPSGDLLLSSLARILGRRALGVVLTGMGDDGSVGARELRQAGGQVAAQDEQSSVVFGMPQAAISVGGADVVLPLDQIAGWVVERSGCP